VPTLEGAISLTLPANSQNGKRLRIKGKGLGKAGKRGDLYVVLRVTLPDSASHEEQALWQQLAEKSDFNPRVNWGRTG
jgi:curved DNA-binding protein